MGDCSERAIGVKGRYASQTSSLLGAACLRLCASPGLDSAWSVVRQPANESSADHRQDAGHPGQARVLKGLPTAPPTHTSAIPTPRAVRILHQTDHPFSCETDHPFSRETDQRSPLKPITSGWHGPRVIETGEHRSVGKENGKSTALDFNPGGDDRLRQRLFRLQELHSAQGRWIFHDRPGSRQEIDKDRESFPFGGGAESSPARDQRAAESGRLQVVAAPVIPRSAAAASPPRPSIRSDGWPRSPPHCRHGSIRRTGDCP